MNAIISRAKSRLDPAYSVIRKFDTPTKRGAAVIAERLSIGKSTVAKWTLPSDKAGTGGYIPRRHYDAILTLAKEEGIDLDPAEFIVKRPEDLDESSKENCSHLNRMSISC